MTEAKKSKKKTRECADCGRSSAGRYCPDHREAHKRAKGRWEEKKVREGMCAGCYKNPPAPGRVCCRGCLDKSAARMRELYHKRIAAGQCALCGKPKSPAHSRFCPEHAAYMAEKQKQLRTRRRKAG